MTKNKERKSRFDRINEALDSIYQEAAWRHRKQDHEFGLHITSVDDKRYTSRSAGGPTLMTLQYECGVRGIHGLSRIADELIELQKVEAKQQ